MATPLFPETMTPRSVNSKQLGSLGLLARFRSGWSVISHSEDTVFVNGVKAPLSVARPLDPKDVITVGDRHYMFDPHRGTPD